MLLDSIVLFLACIIAYKLGQKSPLFNLAIPCNLIPLNSSNGTQLLLKSDVKQDYDLLIPYFLTQKNTTFCGIASISMILNAFSIPAPQAPELGNLNVFTQTNIFNNKTRSIRTPLMISLLGISLEQLKNIIEVYPVKGEIVYGDSVSLNEFRNLAIKALRESNSFVIVNYWRRTIGQKGLGHISPLAAYNRETDRFLILDVARNKYPPCWVKSSELWQATIYKDITSGKARGLLIITAFNF